jgi:hypothetical protein
MSRAVLAMKRAPGSERAPAQKAAAAEPPLCGFDGCRDALI